MRNAAELRMTPSRCRSCAMWRVLQPGRSNTNLVSVGCKGSRAAQANQRANANMTTTTSLKKVRMEDSSLDEGRRRCAAPQDKERSPESHLHRYPCAPVTTGFCFCGIPGTIAESTPPPVGPPHPRGGGCPCQFHAAVDWLRPKSSARQRGGPAA